MAKPTFAASTATAGPAAPGARSGGRSDSDGAPSAGAVAMGAPGGCNGAAAPAALASMPACHVQLDRTALRWVTCCNWNTLHSTQG